MAHISKRTVSGKVLRAIVERSRKPPILKRDRRRSNK